MRKRDIFFLGGHAFTNKYNIEDVIKFVMLDIIRIKWGLLFIDSYFHFCFEIVKIALTSLSPPPQDFDPFFLKI